MAAVVVVAVAGCSSNTPTAQDAPIPVAGPVSAAVSATGDAQPSAPQTPMSAGPSASAPTAAGILPDLPDELAGFRTQEAVMTARTTATKSAQQAIDVTERSRHLTETAYAKAYGAPVQVQVYASNDLDFLATVIAVAAQSPGLVHGPVQDPADLGLAVNLIRVVDIDQVECLVSTMSPIPTGQQPDPKTQQTTMCQRTGHGLSALVYGIGYGIAGQNDMIALTNAAWSASGGT